MARRKRLLSAFLDHCIVSLVGVPIAMLIDELTSIAWLGIAVAGFIYLNKDCLKGRSLAKRILGLAVVDHPAGITASPIRCMLRNLTIVLWPVEVVLLLRNPTRRLGDYFAKTECVDSF